MAKTNLTLQKALLIKTSH